jgi:hypothetical protein
MEIINGDQAPDLPPFELSADNRKPALTPQQRYRLAHPERCRENTRRYRAAHLEEVRERDAARARRNRAENKDRVAAIEKRRRGKHGEKLAAYQRAYRAVNKDLLAAKDKARREAHREELAARSRDYRAHNKERVAATEKRRRQKHAAKFAAQKKVYREKHAARLAAFQRAYRTANKDRISAREKSYREAHKDRIAAQKRDYHARNKELIAARDKARRKKHAVKIAARAKTYRRKHAARINARWRAWYKGYSARNRRRIWLTDVKKNYGLSSEIIEQLERWQKGKCAICRTPFMFKTPHVDHCHQTGKLRGLLCSFCNSGIAHFNDDPRRIRHAISYLVRPDVKRAEDARPTKSSDAGIFYPRFIRQTAHKIRRRHGLSRQTFYGLIESQGGSCRICDAPLKDGGWNIDHCHRTQRVRGILCPRCNKGIGLFFDQPVTMRLAIRYLKTSPCELMLAASNRAIPVIVNQS